VSVRVQTVSFDVAAEIEQVHGGDTKVGALATFIGTVREIHGDRDATLTLEHYPGMTEPALSELEAAARQRFAMLGCSVVHRVGVLRAGDAIVLVVVSSAHRHEAFSACEFIMDLLKTRAPFWKKEASAAGSQWVESRESDHEAERRWSAERRE
jgi:molybdopterin synthase catalytic subunit